jgi:hypothetical protein
MNKILSRLFVGTVLICAAVSPALGQISVRSGLSDDRSAAPGGTYHGNVVIKNETDEIQQAKIYQTDYRFFADGTNVYGSPGQDPRSNADWTVIASPLVTIPPNEMVDLSYVVTVPESTPDFVLDGSYWSMIMIEALPKQSAESALNENPDEPELGLRQVVRYGIQIATHIEATGVSNLRLDGTGLIQLENGETALNLVVENDGTTMIRPDLWVELYDLNGETLGRRNGVPTRIYPGTSVNQKVSLGDLAPGNYKALVILDAGTDDVFGAEYTLEIKAM